jgi:hypothetical protein
MKNVVRNISKIDFSKEVRKDKKRNSILSLWVTLCMIVTFYIQEFLRPQKLQLSTLGYFLQGTLPSFFGAAGWCVLFFIFHKIYKSFNNEYKLINSITFAFVMTFGGLTLWEFMRMIIRPFDIYDIVMTFLGCAVSSILIFMLYFRDLNNEKKHCR